MADTTTIRLPPKLRARLAVIAKQTDRSVHSIIVEAVEKHAAYEEQMRKLVKEAIAADEDMDRTGEVYRAEDVHAWAERLADGSRDRQAQAMAKVVHSAGALAALESALEQKLAERVDAAAAAAVALRSGFEYVATHPLVGRRIEGDLRELVISYGATGYIALYRFVVQRDEVRILALRHQREIGYLP